MTLSPAAQDFDWMKQGFFSNDLHATAWIRIGTQWIWFTLTAMYSSKPMLYVGRP